MRFASFSADERVWSDGDARHSKNGFENRSRCYAHRRSQIFALSTELFAPLPVHVALAPARLRGCAAIVANAEELPFRDTLFDLVLCAGSVIHHG